MKRALIEGPFATAASGPDGAVRAVELRDHPFVVATLFQPERAALAQRGVPLVSALVAAAAAAPPRSGRCC